MAQVFIFGNQYRKLPTDLDGNFTLKVPAITKLLNSLISGMKRRSSEFNPQNLNVFHVVTMKEDSRDSSRGHGCW